MNNIIIDSKVLNFHSDAIPYLSFEMLDSLGYKNLYTTRYKKYVPDGEKITGLRVALMKSEDSEEALPIIKENLIALGMQLGADAKMLRTTKQEHTSNVVALEREDFGLYKSFENLEPIDGMITNIEGAGLIVYGADCPSIYIVDPKHNAIGLVHAGWRGTLGKIPQVAINMMHDRYGSNPTEMYAAIGPSICEKCYEMGDEVFDKFAAEWGYDDAKSIMKRHDSGKYHLDLWKANRMTLGCAGIPIKNIAITDICTCCNSDDFYSYRAHKMENEQCAMLINKDY